MTEKIGAYPNVTMKFLPRPCMQCENSPCIEVCPVTAAYHNAEQLPVFDGVVIGGEMAAGHEHASQEYGEAWKHEERLQENIKSNQSSPVIYANSSEYNCSYIV